MELGPLSGAIDLVLATAKLSEYEGIVYSIGPFGARVGFAFQQERALNLVHALFDAKKIVPKHRVLIVGGGLAGLTAKLALHGMGVGNVFLYEALDELVKSQHDARHRMVHPCYNNWPLAERFSPTSDLPFLNWFAANAAEVVGFLRGRWETLYSRNLSQIFQGKLTELKLTSNRKQVVASLEIPLAKPDGTIEIKIENQIFDRAIFATGVGLERDLGHSFAKSYWTPDEINTLRENNSDTRQVYVSGIGDGGLMDLVRLAFRNPKDGSDLAIETVSRLRHTKYLIPRETLDDKSFQRSPIEEMIWALEKEACDLLPETSTPTAYAGTAVENRVAELLQQGYKRAIEILPLEASEFLERHVHPIVTTDRLHLVGKLVAPFTYATAPINKLLVAYLLRKKPEIYLRGRVDVKKNEIVAHEGTRSSLAPHVVVIRHGGQPPVYEFSKQFEKQNRALYRDLADLLDVGRPPASIFSNLRNLVAQSPTAKHVVKYRTELAEAFSAAKGVNLKIAPRFRKAAIDEFWFEFDPGDSTKTARISGLLGGFPHEIFGVPLIARTALDAELGLGST